MAEWTPMTDEQRQRWKETGLFPVERWGAGQTDATPLVCPMPDRALLRQLAEAVPAHIQSSGWYATGQRYESRTVHSVYGDNFRGMGRQAIASVISVGSYSGPLADYIAAACPRTVLRLLDRIEELERAAAGMAAPSSAVAMAAEYQAWLDFFHAGEGDFHDFQKRRGVPASLTPGCDCPGNGEFLLKHHALKCPYRLRSLGVLASDAPQEFFCNKCGYFGPVEVFHERPNGSGKCDYMAVPMKAKVSPPGWSCSRDPGHEGPCAARPDGVLEADDWQRPDNTCPRCKKPAANLFHTTQPGDELATAHCGCLYASGAPVVATDGKPLLRDDERGSVFGREIDPDVYDETPRTSGVDTSRADQLKGGA
jgi:hypothetical protein